MATTIDHATELEPFVLLAKSSRGAAAAKTITNAISAPGVYVFSELLEQPSVQDLGNTSHANHLTLLSLFAYGTLADYRSQAESVPPLEPAQLLKLKHLTLVSLALKSRSIRYSIISESLEIDSVRDLEDLIIDVMYAGLLGGKMHHDEKILHVDWVTGRDVNPQDLPLLAQSLQNWCQTSNTLLAALDEQITYVRQSNKTEQTNTQLYNDKRNKAYSTAMRESKKGSKAQGGNYNPPPPAYGDEGPMTFDEGRLADPDADLELLRSVRSGKPEGTRSSKRFKSDEMEE